MARYELSGTFALSAGTAKTVARVMTPASRKLTLRRVEIVDRLAGSTDSGILYRVLTGGTDGTGTAATPTPLQDAKACLSTAKLNYTVEPTGSPTETERGAVPAGGGTVQSYEGDEGIEIPHSSAIAVELTAAQARASDMVSFKLIFEE